VLKPAKGGKVPEFSGNAGWVNDRIRQEMFDVYTEKSMPIFLDARAAELLTEARENFKRFGLSTTKFLSQGNTTYLFCWMGDRVLDTLAAMLRTKGLKATNEGISLSIFGASPADVKRCLQILLSEGRPDTLQLSRSVKNKAKEKYDYFLTDELLSADYAASKLDDEGALNTVNTLIASD
jgi:ATP-dependent Lhr-like helicase